jgi:hypothetical protein
MMAGSIISGLNASAPNGKRAIAATIQIQGNVRFRRDTTAPVFASTNANYLRKEHATPSFSYFNTGFELAE